jgi:glycosyltransferase involved in cell wall biosynthesis
LTVRHHALAPSRFSTVVFGGLQSGPVFLDVTFRLVRAPYFIPGTMRVRYAIGLIRPLRVLRPVMIEVHAEPLIALWLQRRFPAIPVALVLHDDPTLSGLTRTPGRRARLLRRVARVLTVSEWLRDRLLDGIEHPTTEPIVVPPCVEIAVPPGSDYDLDGYMPPEPEGATPRAQGRPGVVLFAGRLTAEKGADLFVAACTRALAFLPGWRAEIVGAAEHQPRCPETPFVRMLRAVAEPAGISMIGYRDHPDAMAAMARAAIVVVPSRTPEPSGRVALEAMANGAAVICAPTGALPEIAGDVATYVDPTQTAELADAILALGGDPRRLAAQGDSGRRRAAAFEHSRIGQWMETVRARIVADGPPGL